MCLSVQIGRLSTEPAHRSRAKALHSGIFRAVVMVAAEAANAGRTGQAACGNA